MGKSSQMRIVTWPRIQKCILTNNLLGKNCIEIIFKVQDKGRMIKILVILRRQRKISYVFAPSNKFRIFCDFPQIATGIPIKKIEKYYGGVCKSSPPQEN